MYSELLIESGKLSTQLTLGVITHMSVARLNYMR